MATEKTGLMNNILPPVPNVSHLDDVSWGLVRDWLSKVANTINNNPPVVLGGSQGLTGYNGGTPTSQMQFTATTLLFRSPSGAGQFLNVTPHGTYYGVDITVAGPIVGGRDQAAAFAANSWVHFYFIFNPTTNQVGLIASASAQDVGPSMPAGFSHFSYCGAVGLDSSSHLYNVHMAGTLFTYDDPTTTHILLAGAAVAPASLSAGTYSPPNATSILYTLSLSLTNSAIAQFTGYMRPHGYAVMCPYITGNVQVAGGAADAITSIELAPGLTGLVDYDLNAAPTTGGLSVYVAGYRVPNAAS